MKVITCFAFLVLWSLVKCTPQHQPTCNLEKVIQDVVTSVLSEAASSLVGNTKKPNSNAEIMHMNNDYTSNSDSSSFEKNGKCPPKDCADIATEGHTQSGLYKVWPEGWKSCGMEVYCDLEKDDGGWTVIQRRGDFGKPKDYFYKRWRDYKFGFGNLSEDFWLGNDKIHHLSNQDNYILRVDMKTKEEENAYAQYEEFHIEPESNKYKLWIYGFQGDAGDSLGPQNGQFFATYDRDYDNYEKNCAEEFKGAWWYNKCHLSNLNGQYLNGQHESFANGINWKTWKGYYYSYPEVVMKIRPSSFSFFRDQRKLNDVAPVPL